MRIEISDFKGIAPAVLPDLLADGFAQSAVNVRLDRGLLESHKGLGVTAITVPSNTNSMFQYQPNVWFTSSSAEVTFADAQKVSDPNEYAIIADVAFPKITRLGMANVAPPYPSAAFRLGVVQPTLPPTLTVKNRPEFENFQPDPDEDVPTFTAYRYSVVDGFGREGALSPASIVISYYQKQQYVEVNIPTPNFNATYYMTGWKARVYRVNPAAGGGYQMVAEVSPGTFSDLLMDEALGLPPETEDWYEPPDDDVSLNPGGPLRNLTAMPGGFFIGSSGDELCASVIDAPHAWPYRQSIGEKIQGIAVMGNAAVLATTGSPYVVQGVDPSSLQATKLNRNQSCVSPRSVVSVGDSVIYASPDGLVAVSGYDAKVITEGMITKEEWQRDFNPSSIHAYYYEGKYIFFTSSKGYVLTFGRGLALTELNFVASAGYSDLTEDKLYLMVGGALRVFDDALPRMQYSFKSKEYRFDWPTSFSCIKVNADAYPVPVTLNFRKPNGAVKQISTVIKDSRPKSIPTGFSAIAAWAEVTSDKAIKAIIIASDKSEIMEHSGG